MRTTQTKTTNTLFQSTACIVEAVVFHPEPPPPETIIRISFRISVAELDDFNSYADWADRQRFRDSKFTPYTALHCFAHNAREIPQRRLYTKPMQHGIQSPKGCIERSKKLLKTTPNTTFQIECSEWDFEGLKILATHYGISVGEACLLFMGYFAALHRRNKEKQSRKTPFAKYEKSLRDESRATTAAVAH